RSRLPAPLWEAPDARISRREGGRTADYTWVCRGPPAPTNAEIRRGLASPSPFPAVPSQTPPSHQLPQFLHRPLPGRAQQSNSNLILHVPAITLRPYKYGSIKNQPSGFFPQRAFFLFH